jgi:hypothetical protein
MACYCVGVWCKQFSNSYHAFSTAFLCSGPMHFQVVIAGVYVIVVYFVGQRIYDSMHEKL